MLDEMKTSHLCDPGLRTTEHFLYSFILSNFSVLADCNHTNLFTFKLNKAEVN